MASTIASCVRLTFKKNAILRACRRCGVMSPLARHEDYCSTCQTPTSARRNRSAA